MDEEERERVLDILIARAQQQGLRRIEEENTPERIEMLLADVKLRAGLWPDRPDWMDGPDEPAA